MIMSLRKSIHVNMGLLISGNEELILKKYFADWNKTRVEGNGLSREFCWNASSSATEEPESQ